MVLCIKTLRAWPLAELGRAGQVSSVGSWPSLGRLGVFWPSCSRLPSWRCSTSPVAGRVEHRPSLLGRRVSEASGPVTSGDGFSPPGPDALKLFAAQREARRPRTRRTITKLRAGAVGALRQGPNPARALRLPGWLTVPRRDGGVTRNRQRAKSFTGRGRTCEPWPRRCVQHTVGPGASARRARG